MARRHQLCMLKVRCCMTHLVSDLVRLGWAARPGFVAEREQPVAALPETEESGNHTTWAEVQEAMAISEAARLEDVAAAQAAAVEGVGTVCPRRGKPPPTDFVTGTAFCIGGTP